MLGAGYEIKITPPASEIELYVLGKKITQEQTIEPGASIEVKTGNNTGTFSFTVKEIKNTLTRNVNVSVTTNPEYATGLTIGTLDNASTEVEVGKTLKLVANVTPTTATDDVTWKVESGSATVDTAGTVTAKEDATVGSKIVVLAKLTRKDGTATTVGQKTIKITVKQASSGGLTAANIASATNKSEIYGKPVNYTPAGVTTDVGWKIFYSDGTNIYLIADNYVERTALPASTKDGVATKHKPNAGSDSYGVRTASFSDDILNDYSGAASIATTKLQKLNNSFFSQGFTSTKDNMKSVVITFCMD